MNLYSNDYKKLYLLQDKVLRIFSDSFGPFYLTGGTALSRFYLHHRYSEDIDLFVNNNPEFQIFVSNLRKKIELEFEPIPSDNVTYSDFVRIWIKENDSKLKIEFVNDVAARYGQTLYAEKIPVDNPANILSNKIAAICGRDEAKDIYDIICMAENYFFNWKDIFMQTLEKAGIAEQDVAMRISTFPPQWLYDKLWLIHPVSLDDIQDKLKIIADDFLFARDNSLGIGKVPILEARPYIL